jgi:hypothetical protein
MTATATVVLAITQVQSSQGLFSSFSVPKWWTLSVALFPSVRERERQRWHEERHEKDRQNPLSAASEGYDLVFGRVEGPSSARVSAIADLQGVTSSFDWHLDRVMQFDRPDRLTVDQDIERATTDLHADWFSRQFERYRHFESPFC